MELEKHRRKHSRCAALKRGIEADVDGSGTKYWELEENIEFQMSPRTAKRALTRPVSCSTAHALQPHRKSLWLSAPKTAQCAAEGFCELVTVASSEQDSDAYNNDLPIGKKRKIDQLSNDVRVDKVTRDLCNNFKDHSKDSPKVDVTQLTLWKTTSTSSNGLELHRSGVTCEEDLDGNTSDGALVTVRSAAELLTKLTYNQNVVGDSPGITSAATYSPPEAGRQAKDEPIRWGFRKKVSYDSRRSVDSCDLGLSSGIALHQANSDKAMKTVSADQKVQEAYVPYNFTENKWETTSPNPVPSELYRQRDRHLRSSVEVAGEIRRKSPSKNTHGQRDRQNKLSSSSGAMHNNILKLPKDMQGRWSSERYKSAQLKLIEIMHLRKAVPGRPILRPALREEARKHIGDTGLLDHLLKHMTDTVVSTGERFRRRHNSEGAMEYWLEHPSLMELRKAAGVEDPSWIPPPGWKPGDRLAGRHWQINRGMTASEAAEMKSLKETVDKLKSEMKVLCGRLKGSDQSREMATEADRLKRLPLVPFRKTDEVVIERIQKDMVDFRAALTTMQKQFDQDQKVGSNFSTTVERFQKLEDEMQQISEDRRLQQENSAGNKDLEGELQDVRNSVTMMQADVSCIMRILGFVPPSELTVMTTPTMHLLESNPDGNFMPLVVSKGEETCITDLTSFEPRPPGTSPVCQEFASQNHDSPNLRQCTGLKSATSSSTGGNTTENHTNYTEGLARALSNYNLVHDTSRQTAHGGNEQKNLTPSSAVSGGCEPIIMENEEKRSLGSTYSQDFKGVVRSRPTGFKVCRPPGTFIWPSMMNISQFNPNFAAMNPKVLEVFRTEVTGSGSARTSGYSLSSGISSIQTNSSARSIAESQVAATMAGMFGCMAPQQAGAKLDAQVPGSSSNCVFLPGTGHTPQRANYNPASKVGHTGSPGVQQHNAFSASTRTRAEPPPGQLQAQRTPPLCDPTKYPAGLSTPHWRLSSDVSSPALPTLPLMTSGVESGGKESAMGVTPNTADFTSNADANSNPTCSLSLSLSLGSSTPGIHCDNLNAPKIQKSI